MTIRLSIRGVKETGADLQRISKEMVDGPLLEVLALDAKAVVLKRTGQGRDYQGIAFKPYSPAYKRHRTKRGRQVSRVDLQMRRHMLADMHTRINVPRAESRLTFRRTEEKKKAIFHHITGAGTSRVKRQFFGLNKKDIARLTTRVNRHIKKVIQ